MPSQSGGVPRRGMLRIVLFVVGGIGVLGIAAALIARMLGSQTPPGENAIVNQAPTNGSLVNEAPANAAPPPIPANLPEPGPPDQDHDGLTDAEEAELGTDRDRPDTDADTLYDYEEVRVFQTDPNDSDTDDDGFFDGQEVRAGYDPNGPGQLLNINRALRNTNS